MRYAPQGPLYTIRSSLHAKFVLVLSAIAILVGALSAIDLAATDRSLNIAQQFIRMQRADKEIYDGMVSHTHEIMLAERDIISHIKQKPELAGAYQRWQTNITKLQKLADKLTGEKHAPGSPAATMQQYMLTQKASMISYTGMVEDIVIAAHEGNYAKASSLELRMADLRKNMDKIREKIDQFRDEQGREISNAANAMALQAAQSRLLVIFISFIFLLAIFAAVLIFPSSITRPLSRLCEATDWLAAGDLTTRVKVDRHDEIGRLAANFNGMANTIEHRTIELEQQNQQLVQAQKRLRKHAKRIEKMRKEALQANEAKSEFLARMSHEIRTPLAATLGFSDLLLDQCDSPEQMHECVRIIQQNGQHLLSIINDILDLSKIEAGKLSAQLAPSPIVSVLAEVSSLMRYKAEKKGLKFRLTFETPIPERIVTDSTRFRQILLNLLNNAIKFTHHGAVELKVRLSSDERDGPYLCCDIRDDGIGMSQNQIQQLFQPFVQVHQNTTQYGGTGLGLAISYSLTQMLGGDLTVTSALGKGSTFHLKIATGDLHNVTMIQPEADLDDNAPTNIPIPPPSPDAPKEIVPVKPADRQNIRVLVAEDTPELRRYMEIILSRAGYECDLVESGPDALERIRFARRENKLYTVILLDLLLPGMDGFEVLQKLQREHDRTPVVALTAHAMRHVKEKCLKAGFTEFVSKPVNRAALIEMIQQLAEAQNKSEYLSPK